jgi:hypothetical protein
MLLDSALVKPVKLGMDSGLEPPDFVAIYIFQPETNWCHGTVG